MITPQAEEIQATDALQEYYHEKNDCFALQLKQTHDRFELKDDDIIVCYERTPMPGDLIACAVSGNEDIAIAKFIKGKNGRLVVEAANGLIALLVPSTTVVIQLVLRHIKGQLTQV